MNKTFIMGTLLLITAAFLGECLEFLINMLLARELGETGLGMYPANHCISYRDCQHGASCIRLESCS